MIRTGALIGFLFATSAVAQDAPRVVAVNGALQSFAEYLLEDEVSFPIPADVDPSFWRPSISDISEIQSADLILLNGAGFATWVDRVTLPRAKLVDTSRAIRDQFIVTESITHSHGDGGEHSHEGVATYVWLDPQLAIAQADAIAQALAVRGLADADAVYARLTELTAELEAADAAAATALADASAVIATHPRYQYFARRYGLDISYLEWDAGAAPNEAELADLSAMAAETGASVLIWEATPPEAAIAAVADLGLTSVIFPPLAHPSAEGSYLDGFTASVLALASALSP